MPYTTQDGSDNTSVTIRYRWIRSARGQELFLCKSTYDN